MSGIKIIKRVKSSNIPYKGKARYDSSLPANKHDPEQGEKGAESSRRRVQHKGYKHASIVGDTQQREILPPIHNLYMDDIQGRERTGWQAAFFESLRRHHSMAAVKPCFWCIVGMKLSSWIFIMNYTSSLLFIRTNNSISSAQKNSSSRRL